jgi:uracil-DNA glycosylase
MTETQNVKLNESWRVHLEDEFQKDYMISLRQFLRDEIKKGKTIYPHGGEFFNALNTTDFDLVKVVIIGQDPYHGPDQAHGLSFSVKHGIKPPPSLVNIFKEISSDLDINQPLHGCLNSWAKQGILLLNSVLSVEKNLAASHQGKGWETFTDRVIDVINSNKEGVVFLLWGSYAQKKGKIIDKSKHLVLESPHPSPLSAHRGFLGNKHFSKTNAYLKENGKREINWKLQDIEEF